MNNEHIAFSTVWSIDKGLRKEIISKSMPEKLFKSENFC